MDISPPTPRVETSPNIELSVENRAKYLFTKLARHVFSLNSQGHYNEVTYTEFHETRSNIQMFTKLGQIYRISRNSVKYTEFHETRSKKMYMESTDKYLFAPFSKGRFSAHFHETEDC